MADITFTIPDDKLQELLDKLGFLFRFHINSEGLALAAFVKKKLIEQIKAMYKQGLLLKQRAEADPPEDINIT